MNIKVYTPQPILDKIVPPAFTYSPWNYLAGKILDPCVGTGNILLDIAKTLIRKGVDKENLSDILWGIDTDEDALVECERRFFSEVGFSPRLFHQDFLFDFEEKDFDIVVMNPPFAGKNKISGIFGKEYKDRIVEKWGKPLGDISAYFLRRACEVSSKRGVISMVASNTISQGITRLAGLKWCVDNGWEIMNAWNNLKWPNADAQVNVSCVTLRRIK